MNELQMHLILFKIKLIYRRKLKVCSNFIRINPFKVEH